MTAIYVFAAQFALIILLGLQSRFVRDSQHVSAAINSYLLGVCGLVITPQIADPELFQNGQLTLAAYLNAGPIGIVTAIVIHDFMKRHSQ